MTSILIGIITLLLSANFIFYSSKPCQVKWYSDLRNHEQRLLECKLQSSNRFMEWVEKE